MKARLSSGLVFGLFAAIGLYFLLAEHRAHLAGWLPYLLLLACPLLHVFHRHGHHGHHHHPGPADPRADGAEPRSPSAGGAHPH